MTFSVLVLDPDTGALGGAAATGNLCVGGWVLRGDARGGMTASQGLSPSTLWGEDALAALCAGATAQAACAEVTAADPGRAARQLSIIDRHGATAGHDGADNLPWCGRRSGPGWVAAGNWLASAGVLDAAARAATGAGRLEDRLLAALAAGVAAGSDTRGTLSAALLVVAPDRPPLDLRVDHDPAPVTRLAELLAQADAPAYRAWLATLPTRAAPGRRG